MFFAKEKGIYHAPLSSLADRGIWKVTAIFFLNLDELSIDIKQPLVFLTGMK